MIIDIFADVICPWCDIGEQRLEAALKARPELDVEWRWRPFQLRPNTPVEGDEWNTFAARLFGDMDRAQAAFARVTSTAAQDGIVMDYSKMTVSPNTALAHRLVLLAQKQGLQKETVEALFRAHFEEGKNIGDAVTLAELAAEVGLNKQEVEAYLQSDEGADEVEASQRQAAELGIQGVPFFIFDEKYAISGAQPLELFLQTLDTVAEEQNIAQGV